jgi:Domain of unknown function (DUF4189)
MLRKYIGLSAVLLMATASTAKATNYGAIAFEDRLAFGYSYNWKSQQQADVAALHKCQDNCKVIGRYWDNCSSLAVAKNGAYGWDANLDEVVATGLALNSCNRYGTRCETKVTVCNNVSTPPSDGDRPPYFGRHGCWSANWNPIPYCKD